MRDVRRSKATVRFKVKIEDSRKAGPCTNVLEVKIAMGLEETLIVRESNVRGSQRCGS